MRRSTSIETVLVAALALLVPAACTGADDDPGPESDSAMDATVDADGTEGPAFSEEVRTEFAPPAGASSDARGTLRLLVPVQDLADEDLRLRVELAGLSPGTHAWHVHAGPCGTEAPVEIPLSAGESGEGITEALMAGDDGTVTEEIAVPPLNALWVRAGSYSVRVHERAGSDHGRVVACATL